MNNPKLIQIIVAICVVFSAVQADTQEERSTSDRHSSMHTKMGEMPHRMHTEMGEMPHKAHISHQEQISDSPDKATATLEKEHDVIALVIDAARKEATRLMEGGEADLDKLAKFTEFFSGFADACHHAKEEKELFPAIRESNGQALQAAVESLIVEHEAGRDLIGLLQHLQVRASEGVELRREIGVVLQAYAALMKAHIAAENLRLFPSADELLSEEAQEKLAHAFARIEVEEIGEGVHEKYHALAMELAGKTETTE